MGIETDPIVPPEGNKGATNHDLARQAERTEVQRPAETGQPIEPAALSRMANPEVPRNPQQMQEALSQFRHDTNNAGQVQATLYRTPDGRQVQGFDSYDKNTGVTTTYLPNKDGNGWDQYTKDERANTLRPVDGSGQALTIGGRGQLMPEGTVNNAGTRPENQQLTSNPNPRQFEPMPQVTKDNHQQMVAPTIDRSTRAIGEPPRTFTPPVDTAVPVVHPNQGGENTVAPLVKPQEVVTGPQPQGEVIKPQTQVEQQVRPNLVQETGNPNMMTPEYRAQIRAQQLQQAGMTPEALGAVPHNATFHRSLGQQPQLETNAQGTRPYLEGKVNVNANPSVERPGHNPANPNNPGNPLNPGERPGVTGNPQNPHGAIDRGQAKPGEVKPGLQTDAHAAQIARDARLGKPMDLSELKLDGNLRLALERMGRLPDGGRLQLADMIGKFQDGKFNPGNLKEVMLMGMMQKMNPEQLNGLKSFLLDKNATGFRFDQLDLKSQQNLARIFETAFGKGGDRAAGRLLEMLAKNDLGGKIDRVPTADQSRLMLTELFRGTRDSQLNAGRDGLAAKDLSLSLGRNLGDRNNLNPNSAEFRLNARDLNAVMQVLGLRLQSRDLLTPTTALQSDKTLVNVKMDGREAALKDGPLSMQGKELAAGIRDDLRNLIRTNEGIKDAVSKLDTGRLPGQREQADRGLDAQQAQTQRVIAEGDQLKGKIDEKTAGKPDSANTKFESEEEEARKRKEEKESEKRLQDQLLAQQLKEKQEREEKDKKEKLDEEKKKLEEKKKPDEEYTYVVRKGDTLKSIAGRLLKNAAYAEIIYDRNQNNIMLHNHKGQQFAKLFPGQKLIIPNSKYIESFKSAFKSHKHINFDKIPFGSAEEELEAMLGTGWDGAAAVAGRRRLFNDKDDDKPVKRRSFSGGESVSSEERKANVKAVLGAGRGEGAEKQVHKYAVKLGEGLRSIAQKLYDKPAYWRLLAHKNGLSTDVDGKGNPLAQLRRGDSIVLPDPEDFQAFDHDPEAYLSGNTDFMNLVAAVELQEVEITDSETSPDELEQDSESDRNKISAGEHDLAAQAADDNAVDEQAATVIHVEHPLPKAELSKVEIGFEDSEPEWIPRQEPEKLDDIVYIVESEILNGDVRGLSFMLQLYHRGEWMTVSEYQIFPHDTYQVKHKRNGDRTRAHSSLPVKQSKQMARNDFRNNWQNILRDYWRS